MSLERFSKPGFGGRLRRVSTRRNVLKYGAAGIGSALLIPEGLRAASLQETITRGGTLTIGTAQQIGTLDPHSQGLRNNRNSWMGLFDFLTEYDAEGLPQGQLAESWTVSDDGMTWTFALRAGVLFHDGKDLTADDVKFSLDRARDADLGGRSVINYVKSIAEVTVVDPLTVAITTDGPDGALAAKLAPVAIVPMGTGEDAATNPVGTGPFKLQEYISGETLSLTRNESYWRPGEDGQPLPYLDGVVINTLTDTNALYNALTTGTVQAFWQMPDQIQVQAEGNSDIQLVPAAFPTTHDEYFFQADAPPFNDPNARRALLLALDKEAIAEAGYFGRANPRLNNNLIAPGLWAEDPTIPDIPRDPETAKQLFEAAGVTELKFLGYNETPQFKPISQVMERNLDEIGIKLTLEFTDLTTWFSRIKLGTQEPWGDGSDGNAFTVNISVNPPEPSIPTASWGCRSHFGSHYCNEDLAAAAASATESFDLETRRENYLTYQQIWQEDIPAIITCHRAFTHAALAKVHGLADNDGALNYRQAWLES